MSGWCGGRGRRAKKEKRGGKTDSHVRGTYGWYGTIWYGTLQHNIECGTQSNYPLATVRKEGSKT